MAADDIVLDLPAPDGGQVRAIVDASADPQAAVAIYHHGTPFAGPLPHELVVLARASGLRLAEVVRPGYPGSTRQPGRRIADVVPLALTVADALGAKRFVTVGWSGGGPHALATAALAADRCAGALTLAGVGPYGEADLDFLAGMGQDNIDEFGAALQGEAVLRDVLEPMRTELLTLDTDAALAAMSSLLPPADSAWLTPPRAQWFVAGLQHSLSESIDGLLDDDLAFCAPWGFSVADITVPVIVVQGDTDLMVPAAHGRWLASHVPTARPHLSATDGHLSILDDLGTRAMGELRALLT